ncbi:hypothetical protein NP493_238g01049 [Ridgeia piscesae]|uniref:C-type lectin domain-containing protein n=1 Tax=Ridgeia piscesae TaxID=27915 RepID=A0AAD9NZJ7_RIDPI|nr:hypothetical protein NP493_238g01049 [Ridgeia piscesae]
MTFWHGRCYSFLSTPMDVNAARDLCHRTHSTLTTIDTAEEMSWIITTLRAIPTVVTWHIKGAPVVYHRYASPSMSHVTGRCVIIDVSRYGTGTCAWRDVACDSRHAVVCSRLYRAPVVRPGAESDTRATSGTTKADSRPSAQAMGYIAIILVLVELWCVAMLDWHDCVRNVALMRRNIRCCLRSRGCGVTRGKRQRNDDKSRIVPLSAPDVMDVHESAV